MPVRVNCCLTDKVYLDVDNREQTKLSELEESAKAGGNGKWSGDSPDKVHTEDCLRMLTFLQFGQKKPV